MQDFIELFFNLDIMAQTLPLLLKGFWVTLQLCAVVIGLGLAGGLALAVAALSPSRWLRWSAIGFIDFFRALPPLVLLVFVFSGLPFAGLELSPFMAVVVAFLLNNSAYYAEVFRAGLRSVPGGQAEAARATGLSPTQTLASVVLPQAVRNVLPDLLSNTVEVVKLTSLASVVSLSELLYAANMARSVTYNSSPLVLAALIYLALLWPLVRLISRYQRGLAAH
ncbi:amino acid ABC transporter membrane protein 2, PAAT family [Tranquillimonas rosea]|uniref:Amino acid ABC transporter membrane protein 2, PAAT family n=1 Tax=Tranquillimonas rosea TaxID=641238 RepID=A0A1H9WUT3_9RHOB|nr:amino acid ABC transporter permease [Tranquillimonas rosea]SES37163.1 amino acid ABC transporter membrane protein 2, PAAT family [Tranquillimonas rosea]